MKSDKKTTKTFDPDVPELNWDWIQRRRFMNADAEIDPNDSYSKEAKKEKDE